MFFHTLIGVILISAMPAMGFQPQTDTVYLAAGTSIDITGKAYGNNVLRSFCYPGKPRSLLSLFETVELILYIANDDYSEYGGRSPEEVVKHYNEKNSLFSFTLFSQKRTNIQLSPFEQQCIGILSKQPYNVSLKHTQFDMWRLMRLCLGMMIFWTARRLAKNSVFYYLASMVLGICASILVIIAITYKPLSGRPMMYGFLIGGWTIGLYILKLVLDNIRVILVTYREFVLWYLAVTSLLSFLICYRVGPPKNPRSQNIIMWVLQAVGAAIVYFSSWHTSAFVVLLVVTFVAHYCPKSVLKYAQSLYRRRFPHKRRLLTQEEYYQQCITATNRSLSELRVHVNSPQCRQWTVISSLSNPVRFASFANGAPHLYDAEIEDYSRTIEDSLGDTDQEEAVGLLQSNMYYRPTGRRNNQNLPVPIPPTYRSHPLLHNRQLNNNHAENDASDEDNDNECMEQE